MKDSSSLRTTMSNEGVIHPLINLLVDLFLYLLIFNYQLYVKEDVIQRKKRSTSKGCTIIEKCTNVMKNTEDTSC